MTTRNPAVLITGACGGIGHALVKAFHEENYSVIATDRMGPVDDLPFEHFIRADLDRTVTDTQYASEIFQQIREYLPVEGLKALINNAAVQILAPCEELTREAWANTLNVNLLAPFFWTQALLAQLEQANGSVVNISSIHARLTKAGFISYATSKAALSALTRNMAVDIGNRIRVNAIEPAAVGTDMLLNGFEGKTGSLRELESYHPIGRIAEPMEIAKTAVFLCSKNASYLHGSIIPISGGILGCLSDPG